MSTLKALLKRAGLSQQACADALGVSQSSVNRWVRAGRAIPADTRPALEALLGRPLPAGRARPAGCPEGDPATCPCPHHRLKRAYAEGRRPRTLRRHDAWQPEELALVRALAGTRSPAEIADALNAAHRSLGFARRTAGAVARRAEAEGISLWREGYSLRQLASLFRAGQNTLRRRWVEPGLLRATKWAGRGCRGQWLVTEADLLAFIDQHAWAYDWQTMRPGPLRARAELAARRDPWLDTAALARALHTSHDTVQKWLDAGLVPYQRRYVGRRGKPARLVRGSDVPAFRDAIAERRAAARAATILRLRTSGRQRRPRRKRSTAPERAAA